MPEHPQDAIGKDTLRFANEFVEPLLDGEKRVTVRYEFEREYNWGNLIRFVDESGDAFAAGAVRECEQMTVAGAQAVDRAGYGDYDDPEELAAELQTYYPEPEIGVDTVVTVLLFDPVRPLFNCRYCETDEFMNVMESMEPRCPQCESTDVEGMA